MAHRNRDARQAAEATAAASLAAAQAAAQANRVNQTTPFGNIDYSQTGPNQWSVSQTLSPALQSLLQQSQSAQGQALGSVQNLLNAGVPSINTAGLGNLYTMDLGQLGSLTGIDLSQLPTLPTWDTSGFSALQGIDLGALDKAGLFGTINLGSLPAVTSLPVNAGMTGQQAILSRLQPQIDRQREQLQSELINQGFNTSDMGYRQGMQENNQRLNDLLNQAAQYGINLDFTANQLSQAQRAAALNEQQTAATVALANRGEALGEQTASANAARENYAQQLATLLGQTNYGINSYNTLLGGQQARANTNLANYGAQLDAQKALAANALTNRQQGWNEAYQQAGMPLNYLQAYLSLLSGLGGLVQSPGQFGINVPQQATPEGANYLAALQTANQQRASEGANRAGLFGGLGSALGTVGTIAAMGLM